MPNLRIVYILSAFIIFTSNSYAEELHIAVAANFTNTMKKLVRIFESQHPHHVTVSSGSSGKLYAQIRHGAPYDLFFSADQIKPQQLLRNGLAIAGSSFTYAQGQLSLWSYKNLSEQAIKAAIANMDFQKISYANPKLAPYGAAAVQALTHLQSSPIPAGRIALAENVAQAYQFAQSKNVDFAFIASSQLIQQGAKSHGSSWLIPKPFYDAIKQDAVVLNQAKDKLAAKAFLHFLHSDVAQQVIQSSGYDTAAPIKKTFNTQ